MLLFFAMSGGIAELIVQVTTGRSFINQVRAGSGAPLKDTARVTLLPARASTLVGPAGETSSSLSAPAGVGDGQLV